jgi:hypothetical protein
MTILEMIRAQLSANLAERAAREADADALVKAVETEGRSALSDAESLKLKEIREAVAKIDAVKADLVIREAEEVKSAEARAAAEAMAAAIPTTPVVSQRGAAPIETGIGGAVVRAEARTYRPDLDPKGRSFLSDVAARHMGDWDAGERLARHNREEMTERRTSQLDTRAAGTAAFAGLVVPQYLVDLYAPAAAAGRQFANICRHVDLPPVGMTVNISRITTATSAAAQASENAAVSETNIDDTLLTESVFTVAGQQTLSRQAVERGVFTEDVTVDDLIRRYHTSLDSKLINDATTGLTNVAGTVAYTDATPTAAELYPKVLNAQANMEAIMLDQAADPNRIFAVMHSRRWAWMQSQQSSTWPFIQQPGFDPRSGGRNDGQAYTSRIRGLLPNGSGVVVDNNIATNLGAGTNEDEIYVVNGDECFLWEDPSAPMFIRTEATPAASLGILFVVYGYAAYTFRRYTSGQQKVAGTGLITPAF